MVLHGVHITADGATIMVDGAIQLWLLLNRVTATDQYTVSVIHEAAR